MRLQASGVESGGRAAIRAAWPLPSWTAKCRVAPLPRRLGELSGIHGNENICTAGQSRRRMRATAGNVAGELAPAAARTPFPLAVPREPRRAGMVVVCLRTGKRSFGGGHFGVSPLDVGGK